MTQGYVYWAAERRRRGRVKIGFSSDPATRLRSLRTTSGLNLQLVALMPGTRAEERAFHAKYARAKGKRAEWFRFTGELVRDARILRRLHPISIPTGRMVVVCGVVPPAEVEELRALSEVTGVSVSRLVRRAVIEYIENRKKVSR